jgi:hypothetical protein
MKTNPTMKTTQRMMMLMALVWLVLGALACGDSEAVYALQDDPDAMMGDLDQEPVGGKGDTPAEPTVEQPKAPAPGVILSTETLEFEGGNEAFITLENTENVEAVFGKGAVICTSASPMGGVVVGWDGEPTPVYVRWRMGFYVGDWEALNMDIASDGSYRGRVGFQDAMTQVDIYISTPGAIDFLTIEPLLPM